MKKQKLLNNDLHYFPHLFQKVWSFALVALMLSFSALSFAQDVNPCSSIDVSTTTGNGGAPAGIIVSNAIPPIQAVKQAIRIYNENWELVNECTSDECGNPYLFATEPGKYFIQVLLFEEDESWLCQSDPIEVTVADDIGPCVSFCQEGLIELKSQADVDAFCGCEVIEGDVRITGADITSLEPLRALRKVGGFLAILKTKLENLQGLNNLESVGDAFVLIENSQLLNYEGLNKLETIESTFSTSQNPLLKSMEGLNSLRQVNGTIDITNNDQLLNIAALISIQKLRSLFIIGNKSIKTLDGLNGLKSIGEGPTQGGFSTSIVIRGNASLENLDALANLEVLTENMTIQANSSLSDCCGIAHLIDDDSNNGQAKSGIFINDNPEGCNSVEEILGHCQSATPDCAAIALSINANNSQTIDIAGLNAPHYVVKVYDEDWNRILNCSDNCTSVGAYEDGLYRIHVQLYDEDWQFICETDFLRITIGGTGCATPQAVCQGDITLTTQAEVDAFCGCEVIEGNVVIGGDNSDISLISNLKDLTKVSGILTISKTNLSDLSGLNNLKSIGGDLVMSNNPLLKNLNGLNELTHIGRGLFVNNNPIIETLDGLNLLTSLDIFTIFSNTSLTSIQSLKNITELKEFTIFDNKKLVSLKGLNNLVKVGDGMSSGGSRTSIGISRNPLLVSLDPLANLLKVEKNILIRRNRSLANCCGIYHLIDDDPNNGQALSDVQLSLNGANCNSVEEILANCGVAPSCEDITVVGQYENITISNLNAPIKIIKIYDENWNRVFECNNNCRNTTIFETGVGKYYVQVQLYTADWEWICQTDNIEVNVTEGVRPIPTCEDIIVDISDLIMENGQARREVTIAYQTPTDHITDVILNYRGIGPDDSGFLTPENNKKFSLGEGEYAIVIFRYYLDRDINNRVCIQTYYIDVPSEPCTDNDGDYICDYNECNDNDRDVITLKRPVGTACNDDDESTTNDVIQADGCTCAGTPISDNPCDNVTVSLFENDPRTIIVDGLTTGHQLVKVYDPHWNVVRDCSEDCDLFGVFNEAGVYRVYAQLYDKDWQYLCETDFIEIEIPSPENSAREGKDFINEKGILLFPNPAMYTLNIKTTALKDKKGTVQIFNSFGQLLEQMPAKVFNNDYETIEVGNYENGLYLMTIKMENAKVFSRRFVVEHLK